VKQADRRSSIRPPGLGAFKTEGRSARTGDATCQGI